MKKVIALGILVLSLFVLGSCGKNSGNKPPVRVDGIATYINDTYHFTVDYPSAWVQDSLEKPAGAAAAFRFDKAKDSKLPVKIIVWKKTLGQRIEDIKKATSFKSQNKIGFAKLNWERIITNAKDNTQTFIILLTENEDYLYEISSFGFENGVAVNDDIFSLIASSFDFIEKGN